MSDWTEEFPAAVTVTDPDGIILAMNHRSRETFAKYGGGELVGRQVLDCHPGASRETLAGMLAEPRVNAYTVEKGSIRKLIYQAPWYRDGHFAGYVELSLPIPPDMPHFVRD